MELQNIALFLAILLTTYLTVLCHTPPNPNPTGTGTKSAPEDRLHTIVGRRYLILRRLFLASICGYHALIVLFYPNSETLTTICPNHDNLNPSLFTWSTRSTIYLLIILIFTSMRLLAFAQLGSSFTFALGAPKSLTTTGMYAYLQHPSYIANFLLITGNIFLFFQPDGVMGCWMSANAVNSVFWKVFGWGLAVLGYLAGRTRVRDEEAMLKKTFGKEWEDWHKKTNRFIPGVW